MSERDDTSIFVGSGNVFADLGYPNPEEHLMKIELAHAIGTVIASRKLTQTAAAEMTGLRQPDVSDITRGRVREFSTDRLLRVLNALDQDVRIVVGPKRDERAVVTVERAAG
jgi:predicted XRE-type DNA-binding protein